MNMLVYKLTAFESNGETILDETIEAKNDVEAKVIGGKLLNEHNLTEKTHRLVTSDGKLLLFHV